MSFMRWSVVFMCWSVVFLRFSVVVHVFSVVFHVFVSCPSRLSRFSFSVCQLWFMCFSVSFLPAKLLKLSDFVFIPTHLFRTFSVSKPHFFLFSQSGNVTHYTHYIYNFVENQALGSLHSHNIYPTRSQHLTTLPRERRKCSEL